MRAGKKPYLCDTFGSLVDHLKRDKDPHSRSLVNVVQAAICPNNYFWDEGFGYLGR